MKRVAQDIIKERWVPNHLYAAWSKVFYSFIGQTIVLFEIIKRESKWQ